MQGSHLNSAISTGNPSKYQQILNKHPNPEKYSSIFNQIHRNYQASSPEETYKVEKSFQNHTLQLNFPGDFTT